MNLNDIRVAIDHVIEDAPLLYDLSVTTPPPDLVRQRTQDHYNTSMPDSHCKDFSIHENCKSVIVWNVFSTVAYDYHYKNEFLPKILMYLNYRWGMNGYSFGYDNYVLNRKQFAIRSGSATLAKNSLAFHEKFGLNYKIELILTNCEFEETTIVDGNPHYDNCLGCPAPCVTNCPMNCKMDFELVDWEDCANFVDTPAAFKDLDGICRICQTSCPYSEQLKSDILEVNPNYGMRLNV